MSLARLAEVYRVEIAHHLRRPLFWVLLLLLAYFSWELSTGRAAISSGSSDVGRGTAWITSEFAVSQLVALMVVAFYALFAAVAAGMTVIREHELKVGELLHATPLAPAEYVWGKFLAVLTSFLALLALNLALLATFNHAVPHGENADAIGPFHLLHYLKPGLLFGVPFLVFVIGTSFALGALTRVPILVFAVPVVAIFGGLFFLWNWSPAWLDPGVNRLLMVIDLSAVRWLQETWLSVDKGVDFYNRRPVGFDPVFAANRGLALGLGLGAVVLTAGRFARRLRGSGRVRAARRRPEAPPAARAAAAPLAALGMRSRAPGFVAATLETARAELRELRRHPGLYLFGPLIVLQTLGQVVSVGAFDTRLLLTPGFLAVDALGTLTVLLALLTLFYLVESLHRERSSGVGAIVYATPAPSGALLAGKALANAAVGAVIVLAALGASALVVASQGRVAFDLGPYALVWGLLLLPTLLAWSAFVAAAYAATGHRVATYAIGLAALALSGFLQARDHMNWVGNWMLWGATRWTDIAPFELDRLPLFLNRVMVLGLAALLAVAAARWFRRREADAVRVVHRLRPGAVGRAALGLAPFAAVPLVAGAWLGTLVASGWEGPRTRKLEHDYWKQNALTWRDAPSPGLAAVDLDVGFEPRRRRFTLRGSYRLVNPGERPMERFALTGGNHWRDVAWTLDGVPAEPENRSRLYVFTPPRPLAPGDSIEVGFSYHGVHRDGISRNGAGSMEFILPSAIVLTGFSGPSLAPQIGWLEDVGVEEKKNRADGRVHPDGFHAGVTPAALPMAERWFTTRLRLTGPADFQFQATGRRVADSLAGGRRTTLWVSDRPVRTFNIIGGRWATKRGDGAVVHYHPDHPYNVDEMLSALSGARRWFSEWFAPYPWAELRLSEFPALATYAQAPATNISFSENIGFLARSEPRARLAFAVAAHEAAHQWWGNLVTPGRGPGGEVMSEGMAHFSTILLVDQVLGAEQRMVFCRQIEDRYANRRRADEELPLTRLDMTRSADRTVLYDRGGWALWMLFEHLGRERALGALRSFVAAWRDGRDHPVLEDYLAHLRRHAADTTAYDAFVRRWFREVTVPEYRLGEVAVARAAGGWEVRGTIRNAGTGTAPVEIAAIRGERFPDPDRRPASAADGYREARTMVELGPGASRPFVIRCRFEPEELVVDPDVRVLQLERAKARTRLARRV